MENRNRACEIWCLNQSAEQELMGRIMLGDDGKLSSEFTPGNRNAIVEILERPTVSGEGVFDSQTQTEAWFDALPIMYHGTRMWAQMG